MIRHQGLRKTGNINTPCVGSVIPSPVPLELVGLVESIIDTDRHVTFLSPYSVPAAGSQVFTVETPVESARPRSIPFRRHPWSHRALCGSLPHKSISQATSRSSWLPDYRECSRSEIRTMDQVRRVEKEIRSVISLIILPRLIPKQTRTGDLIYLNAAGQPIVVMNSHKVAGDLLDRRSRVYSDRPRNIVACDIMTGGLLFAFSHFGDVWVVLPFWPYNTPP